MATTDADRQPLLSKIPAPFTPPPMLLQPGVEKLSTRTTIPPSVIFPDPAFTGARLDTSKRRRLPQCIAHRGYKAAYPENTILAFRKALEVGAHALETDVHYTRDEVVVLSHDATLKRCFGREEKITDCEWKDIQDLRTLAQPHEPMPRLEDMLELLREPGKEAVWLLVDIKLDNDAESIMRLLGETLCPSNQRIGGEGTVDWRSRVVLGIWAAKYLPLAQQHCPGFPVMHIGFSVPYARHFLAAAPHVGFNMLFPMLVAPGGRSFIREAQGPPYRRKVLAWTVNAVERMEWCIRRGLDGVISDDPALFCRVCEGFDEGKKEAWWPMGWRGYTEIWRIWAWVMVVGWWWRKRFLPVASKELIVRQG